MASPDTRSAEGARSESPTPEEIQAQVAQTRVELGETIEALTAKLDVKQRAKDRAGQTRDGAVVRLNAAKGQAFDLRDRVLASATDGDGRPTPQTKAGTAAAVAVLVAVVALFVLAAAPVSSHKADEDEPRNNTETASAVRRTDVSDAEEAAKPDAPTDLKKPSWLYIARRTLREFSKDQCTDLAATLTYYAVLALFPAMIALLSLIGLVGQGQKTVNTLLQILTDVGASSAASTLRQPLTQLSQSQGAGIALIVGVALALWSASGYVGSFGRAMNRVYDIGEGRPVWKLRPVMLLVTLVTVILAAIALLGLVVTGPAATAVGNAIGVGSTVVTVWNIAKWPVILAIVVVIVALLYYATPNVKQPKFRWMSIGAVFAILIWLVASAAFGFYVANFSSYNKTYGSLAGVIVFLLWLWITNLALLFGAELDAEMERGRQLQAGLPAEEVLQLPVRDTRNIDKAASKEEQDIARGRRLRSTRGQTQTPPEGSDS